MHDNDIKKLIKILEESKIDELEVSTFWGKQKIRLRKSIAINDPWEYFIENKEGNN